MLHLERIETFRLESKRIYLRPLRVEDISDAYLRWMNDPEINQFLESRFVTHTREDLIQFVQSIQTSGNNLFAGIFLKTTDRHIGNIKIGPINVHHAFAELGLLIGEKDCWGKGYASEAIGLFSDFAFETVGVNRIVAGAYAENQGSVRAFLKNGFVEEGIQKNHWRVNGKFQDGICLAKTKPAQA